MRHPSDEEEAVAAAAAAAAVAAVAAAAAVAVLRTYARDLDCLLEHYYAHMAAVSSASAVDTGIGRYAMKHSAQTRRTASVDVHSRGTPHGK